MVRFFLDKIMRSLRVQSKLPIAFQCDFAGVCSEFMNSFHLNFQKSPILLKCQIRLIPQRTYTLFQIINFLPDEVNYSQIKYRKRFKLHKAEAA
jgi:hypothetical protein